MNYSQKYCLVSFVNPIDVNAEFSMEDWPLHITLADVFAIDQDSTNIQVKLKKLFESQPSFKTFASKETILGTTKVTLLDNNAGLLRLHMALIDLLEANGAAFNTPEFTRKGFLPHCAIQKTSRLKNEDSVVIDSVAVIDMFPNKNWRQRKVLNVFKMKNGNTVNL